MKPDYSFQKDLINKVITNLNSHKKCILAAACGAGKTNMAIKIIEIFARTFPYSKILVLTHGQNVLKTQFLERMEKISPFLDFNVLTKQTLVDNKQIYVSIPQALVGIELLTFDLLIVDEAHHFYLSKSVQSLIESIKPKYQLLLSGTPSVLLDLDIPVASVSSGELLNYGVISDPTISLVQSEYDLNFYSGLNNKDYPLDEFNKSIDVKKTEKCIEDVLAMTSDSKIMIATRTRKQASIVHKFLTEKNVSHVYSDSYVDKNSSSIEFFSTNDDIRVLIVVKRGILGFDLPSLGCVVDMTCSLNPNSIFQLLSRVTRVSGKPKTFYKIAPKDWALPTYIAMSFVVALSVKEIYENYRSKYKKNQKIKFPIQKELLEKIESKEFKNREVKIPDLPRMPSFSEVNFNYIKESSIFASTTFGYINRLMSNKTQISYEMIKQSTERFDSVTAWRKKYEWFYRNAVRLGFLKKLFPHRSPRKVPVKFLSKEDCINIAKKFKSRTDWSRSDVPSYNFAKFNNWLDDVCPKKVELISMEFEECKYIASSFDSRTEWKKNHGRSYYWAYKNKWIDKIMVNMTGKTIRRKKNETK